MNQVYLFIIYLIRSQQLGTVYLIPKVSSFLNKKILEIWNLKVCVSIRKGQRKWKMPKFQHQLCLRTGRTKIVVKYHENKKCFFSTQLRIEVCIESGPCVLFSVSKLHWQTLGPGYIKKYDSDSLWLYQHFLENVPQTILGKSCWLSPYSACLICAKFQRFKGSSIFFEGRGVWGFLGGYEKF